jgi:hypothetical protein
MRRVAALVPRIGAVLECSVIDAAIACPGLLRK